MAASRVLRPSSSTLLELYSPENFRNRYINGDVARAQRDLSPPRPDPSGPPRPGRTHPRRPWPYLATAPRSPLRSRIAAPSQRVSGGLWGRFFDFVVGVEGRPPLIMNQEKSQKHFFLRSQSGGFFEIRQRGREAPSTLNTLNKCNTHQTTLRMVQVPAPSRHKAR